MWDNETIMSTDRDADGICQLITILAITICSLQEEKPYP
jgi:hypothetical protein